jgi:hypothetical protein
VLNQDFVGGQLMCLPLLIHLPGNRQFRAVSTMAQKWTDASICLKMRPSISTY